MPTLAHTTTLPDARMHHHHHHDDDSHYRLSRTVSDSVVSSVMSTSSTGRESSQRHSTLETDFDDFLSFFGNDHVNLEDGQWDHIGGSGHNFTINNHGVNRGNIITAANEQHQQHVPMGPVSIGPLAHFPDYPNLTESYYINQLTSSGYQTPLPSPPAVYSGNYFVQQHHGGRASIHSNLGLPTLPASPGSATNADTGSSSATSPLISISEPDACPVREPTSIYTCASPGPISPGPSRTRRSSRDSFSSSSSTTTSITPGTSSYQLHPSHSNSHSHSRSRSQSSSSSSSASPYGYPSPDGSGYCCAYPNCTSTNAARNRPYTFRRPCDLRKHYTQHRKHFFCRFEGCPQSVRAGFATSKDRARHEAKHNPAVRCILDGCDRVFSRVDNMKDHARRIHFGGKDSFH